MINPFDVADAFTTLRDKREKELCMEFGVQEPMLSSPAKLNLAWPPLMQQYRNTEIF